MVPYPKDGKTEYSIQPLVFLNGVRCSGMGSGKSRAVKDMIIADRKAHPKVFRRILVVSARVQQGFTHMSGLEELGAVLYSEERFKDGAQLKDEEFVVCQVE